jgi:hypothetical protein
MHGIVISATSASRPNPALPVTSISDEPVHTSPLGVVFLGIEAPLSIQCAKSTDEKRNQTVPCP